MEFIRECDTKKQCDAPTRKMLDLWHSLCLKRIQNDIEVVVADRRANQSLKDSEGLSTAFPYVVEGKWCLVLWLDSVKKLEQMLLTHELGHWILKLQGYRPLVDTSNPHNEIEINLNSLAQHQPLFKLQRSLGHEPQTMIDAKAQHDITTFENGVETGSQFSVPDGLLAADDIVNSSDQYALRLRNIIEQKYPNTNCALNTILSTMQHYNLHDPAKSLKFSKWLRKSLKLGATWAESGEIQQLGAQLSKPIAL